MLRNMVTFLLCSFFQLAYINNAISAETDNKDIYNLFNPTPSDKMRELSTDRPDKIESAHTVDAGHFQFETDIITYSQDKKDNLTNKDYGFNVINLKLGLTNNLDFHIIVPSYLLSYSETGNKTTSNSGFGDIVARVKLNVWGNDNDSAIAIMPFLKIPTNTIDKDNRFFEGGVTIPAEFELPWDFSLGAMLIWNYVRNEDSKSYNNTIVSSLSIGRDLIKEKLHGYIELYSDKNLHNTEWVVTLDSGLAYLITENIQFDFGANFGLTKEADDINPFIGLSVRI